MCGQWKQITLALFLCSLSAIAVNAHVRCVRVIFGMVGQRNDVQSVAPRLPYLHSRPDAAIRKNRVQVKVALQRLVGRYVGNRHRIAAFVLGIHEPHECTGNQPDQRDQPDQPD